NGVIVSDAARPDLVAEAVEEGDGEFRLLQPVIVRSLAERRDGEREQHDQAAKSHRGGFRERLDQQPAAPAGDLEPGPECREALEVLAQPARGMKYRRIQNGVEFKQQTLELDHEVLAERVAQAKLSGALGFCRAAGADSAAREAELRPARKRRPCRFVQTS